MSASSSARPSTTSRSWDIVSLIRGLWFVATIGFGIWIAIYYAFQNFQQNQDKLFGVSFNSPLAALIVVVLWFAYGHNDVTKWLADAKNSMFHSAILGLGLAAIAVFRFWPVVAQVASYVAQYTDRSMVGTCIGSLALIGLAIVIYWKKH